MKVFWPLTAFALLVLSFAAVWLGELNQDEGWYIYAANLVAEGQMPYRDFFYTQAPLMPLVYSVFSGIWAKWGLLGARIFTLSIGLVSVAFLIGFARRLVSCEKRSLVALVVAIVLFGNLYHLYFLAIPKTYALASLFVSMGFFLVSFEGALAAVASGICMAFACATRLSLGVIIPVVVMGLLVCRDSRGRSRFDWLWFGMGSALAIALVFGPFLLGPSFDGFLAAQRYHASRAGGDIVLAVGSLSRLVRWYLPLFVLLGIGAYAALCKGDAGEGLCRERRKRLALFLAFSCCIAVVVVHILAPVPYEDYNVPVIGLLAACAAVLVSEWLELKPAGIALLALGMTWASSFGCPLLQEWMTNGRNGFWTYSRSKSGLAQLREVARKINGLDPGGSEILTQDLYLAVESGRKVPRQMAMGPFCFWSKLPYEGAEKVLLDDAGMHALLEGTECKIAAMSGYSFAITAPKCTETPIGQQIGYWNILKRRYDRVFTEEDFGQHATPLMVLMRKETHEDNGGTSL